MAKGDQKGGFDELMASMGVRPLDGAGKSSKGKRKSGQAVPIHATTGRAPAASSALPTPRDPTHDALDAARRDLAAAREEAGKREDELGRLRERLEAAAADVGALRERLHDVERHRASLHRALQVAHADVPLEDAPPDLLTVLRDRGLRGPDEATAAFAALAEARQLERLLPLLVAVDTDELVDVLDDRLALVCDAELCQPPPGRARVRVPSDRCDVCGGSDLRRLATRFENACLLHGCKRVTLVGGSPRYHRQLRELLVDPRIRVVLVAGDRRRTARQAKADLEASDLVLLWGATLLDHKVSDLYSAGPARVIRVANRGLAGMLERASASLER